LNGKLLALRDKLKIPTPFVLPHKPPPTILKIPQPATPTVAAARKDYGLKSRETFFADFMGMDEAFKPELIKNRLIFEPNGGIDGKPNFKIKGGDGLVYQAGFLEQISLGELRKQAVEKAGKLTVAEKKPIIFNVIEAEGFNCSGPVDIGALQADPVNRNAVFQVASNFNALETTSHTDERDVNTVADYWGDNPQGPRASISAAPGLIYRRYYYFYPERSGLEAKLWGQRGQDDNKNIDDKGKKKQINFLEDLPVNTMNGYIWGNDADTLQPALSNIGNITKANAGNFKIGYHSGIQVVFGATQGGLNGTQEFFYDPCQIIDQIFAAALNLGQQADLCIGADEAKAKLILEWTYEATLKAAFLNGKRDGNGKIKVFLTRMGGGVFANRQAWIDEAIINAVDNADLANSGLEVTLNNFVFKKGVDEIDVIRSRLMPLVQKHHGTYKLYKVENNQTVETQPVIKTQQHEPSSTWTKIAKNTPYPFRNAKVQCFIDDCTKLELLNKCIPSHAFGDGICRIATYNVHYWTNAWTGFNQCGNFDVILATIENVKADILILQEVNWDKSQWNDLSNSEIIQKFEALGYKYNIFGEAAKIYGAPFGNVIFSKYPFEKSVSAKYNVIKNGEDRSYVHVSIELSPGHKISIFGTHLDVFDESGAIRKQQIEILTKKIDELKIDKNILVAADFNEVRECDYQYNVEGKSVWEMLKTDNKTRDNKTRDNQTPVTVAEHLTKSGYIDCFSKSNFPAPKFTVWSGTMVDFIYLKNWDLDIVGCYVYYSAASDHIPVIMDVKIPK
jgi:endonuclease/exonuclease/phosphatase family metal-dependent hydrolase